MNMSVEELKQEMKYLQAEQKRIGDQLFKLLVQERKRNARSGQDLQRAS